MAVDLDIDRDVSTDTLVFSAEIVEANLKEWFKEVQKIGEIGKIRFAAKKMDNAGEFSARLKRHTNSPVYVIQYFNKDAKDFTNKLCADLKEDPTTTKIILNACAYDHVTNDFAGICLSSKTWTYIIPS